MLTSRTATQEDIAAIRALAGQIWRGCYPGMITHEQIEYMLQRMYAPEVIQRELSGGVVWELIFGGEEAIGFLAYDHQRDEHTVKLHKIYLLPALHGKGVGRWMLDHVKAEASHLGAKQIELQVNKQNGRAIKAYERAGFRIAEAIVADIGGGFVMDDYVMKSDI